MPGGAIWMVSVPGRLVTLLAGLKDAEMAGVAQRWLDLVKQREPRLYEPAFGDNLATLRSHALRAQQANRPMLIMVAV